MRVSASIVIYKHQYSQIADLVDAVCASSHFYQLIIVDNSPENSIGSDLPKNSKLEYVFSGKNLGYGRAHNLAIKKMLVQADYHLVLNPDILFEPNDLDRMISFMEESPNVGLLMPKVLYATGEIQNLCKMLPTPFDLIMRRFIPGFLKPALLKRMDQYELKHKDYNQQMEVPNLSGCFMLLRMEVLNIVGLFDESFFMYLEDTDLSRRINQQFQTIYYPTVSILHHYEKGSYKSIKLLKYHIVSAFRYFSKYGWFFDTVRTTINGTLK
jgi:GT2 family glycosyltransferase